VLTNKKTAALKQIFQNQLWHAVAVGLLLFVLSVIVNNSTNIAVGSLLGINTITWFWVAISVPIAHQIYVWFFWRYELYQQTFSRMWGMPLAFKIYATGFSILFIGRLIAIIIVAVSNRNSLVIEPIYSYLLAAAITPLVVYLFYSVKKYFTIERAFGIDHFERDYNAPYVKKGIFKYTSNGMYIVGLMILYLPGLLYLSEAALLAALFNHIYICVHYYCTELPDMRVIYGEGPGK